ncbi:Glycosyl hydrolase family 109 protein 1 precursor [Bythopirellula goksoeyrii]|uniref:Glycosyl hydrolase family 109 protein 1 n=2 Tax=Bythopirellula goksoeyrii TaxID=1400387 RepID=A0A5B9Q5Z9_9BACT|nr:Glycosyl hydrolase family 109 protein 1 precursor [Bythopirellula goksoeyrii]
MTIGVKGTQMTELNPAQASSRRTFLQNTAVTAATISTLGFPQAVHAAESDTLRVGLVGCGGRGTAAAIDALSADPQTTLVAIGDTFPDRSAACLQTLSDTPEIASRVAVTEDTVFSGFDNFKKVIDSGIDVVLLATPPHFRPEHLAYAVKQGKHSFVEKPIAVDVPGVLSVQKTCEEARQKNLAVVSGLCWRYDLGVKETMKRIQDGAIGEIVSIESRYNTGTLWHRGHEPGWSDMEYQIRNWLYFTWLSGDHINEQAIHSLDKTAWLTGDTQPVQAMGIGGRQQRTDKKYGNIFDHHVVFYEYPSGVRVFFTTRQQDNCTPFVDEIVMGTKGTARILTNRIDGEKKWKYRGPKPSMYRVEHEELFKSIRDDTPINNGGYMTNSTLLAIMGRMCTYTGQDLKWDDVITNTERLGPNTYEWGSVSEGTVAIPGKTTIA